MSENKPDLMAELAAYELVMVSGVSPDNNFRYGLFRSYEQAEAVGKLLLKADAEDHPEWCGYMIDRTHHAELEAAVRDAARIKLEAEQDFLRDWLQFIAYPIGMDCCGRRQGGDCCGDGVPAYPSLTDAVQAMSKRLNEVEDAMHNSAREG